jgi:hypothetical protein
VVLFRDKGSSTTRLSSSAAERTSDYVRLQGARDAESRGVSDGRQAPILDYGMSGEAE